MVVSMALCEPFYLALHEALRSRPHSIQSRLHQNTEVSQPKTETTEVVTKLLYRIIIRLGYCVIGELNCF